MSENEHNTFIEVIWLKMTIFYLHKQIPTVFVNILFTNKNAKKTIIMNHKRNLNISHNNKEWLTNTGSQINDKLLIIFLFL